MISDEFDFFNKNGLNRINSQQNFNKKNFLNQLRPNTALMPGIAP
jgi:hypothetical protein